MRNKADVRRRHPHRPSGHAGRSLFVMTATNLSTVMPGFMPGIHVFSYDF